MSRNRERLVRQADSAEVSMSELMESFTRYFNVRTATTPDQVEQALRLRYQVYCLEHAFENPSEHPDGLECDQFDKRSVHSLLVHQGLSMVAGTVRLVLNDHDCPGAQFPIEQICDMRVHKPSFDLARVPRSAFAEISRFAISKEFKKRFAETEFAWGGSPEVNDPQVIALIERRLIPHIVIGLFGGIVQMSAEYGITHWYAVMEPALLRLLRRFSIHFEPVGPLIDYHGKRQPCVAVAGEVMAAMENGCFEVWKVITKNGTIWPSAQSVAA
ncbi:MAG: PEP-CTERM/exosortase system-associated acyltransferase [Gammaproteobacteria bacterium]